MRFFKFLTVFFFLFISFSSIWGSNRTHGFEDIPIDSVIPSSALIHDSSSLLLNPAALARMDRMNLIFAFGPSLSIRYLSLGMLVPNLGAAAGGMFRFSGENGGSEGLMFGWGSDLSPFFSVGMSLYTISDSYVRYDDGLLFNFGSLITFNRAMGSFFESDWLDNRLTMSVVLQNFGIQPTSTADTEAFNPRIGFAYRLPLFSSSVFAEFLPAVPRRMFFGMELEEPFLKLLRLRFSSDMTDVFLGASLKTSDFTLDFSYDLGNTRFNIGFSAYFDEDRKILSQKLYESGSDYFEKALKSEKNNDETLIGDIFDNYDRALSSLQKSLFFDPNNFQAQEKKENIEDKLRALRESFILKGQKSENKGRNISALVYYQRAALIEKDPSLEMSIETLSTNPKILKFIRERKENISNDIAEQDYIGVKSEWKKLSWIFPKDAEILREILKAEKKIRDQVKQDYQKAQLLYDKGNQEEALTVLKKVLAVFNKGIIKKDEIYQKALYLSYQIRKKTFFSKSLEGVRENLKKKNYLKALSLVNQLLRRNKRNKEVIQLKNKILTILNQNAERYYKNGVAFYNQGNYEKALKEFEKLLSIEKPTDLVRDYQNRARDYKKRASSKLKAIKQLESIGQ